jgi:hypothetical protein
MVVLPVAAREPVALARDVWLDEADRRLLPGLVRRLTRIQRTVGFGNFGVLGFDDMLKVARGYPAVGAFSARELVFLEQVFFTEARCYGFYGRKVVEQLSHVPRTRSLRSVRGTGQRLYSGDALRFYRRMRRDVGADLVLTSGVRSVVKQFHLFLRKVKRTGGNLSLASRSLAPPVYSFHGVGDFDVGLRGFGAGNFTEAFADTRVYRAMLDLGYAQLRYPAGNPYGVRYEPWHIRVVEG